MMNYGNYRVRAIAHGTGKTKRYDLVLENGEPFTIINIPSMNRSETVIAVKNYSENEGMLEFLQENGIIKDVVGMENSGFVSVPIVEIDVQKLLSA